MQIEWTTLNFDAWWPGLAGMLATAYFLWQWRHHHGEIFPDYNLIYATASRRLLLDNFSIILGTIIAILLLLALSRPSIFVSQPMLRTEREFMILLDSSGSMQANTSVLRGSVPLNYQRPLQLGLIPATGKRGDRGAGVNAESVPYLARYEVARESIRKFLDKRRFGDRVGLIYFNNIPFVVSVATQNIVAIKDELKWLDDYVALGTLLYRGLEMARGILESSPSTLKQAVILISDAEVTGFNKIQEELDKLVKLGVSFHLLWLGEEDEGGAEAEQFLNYVKSIDGNILVLNDLTNTTLNAAFEIIDRLESTSYVEDKRHQVDLQEVILSIVRWLILIWVVLISTVYHPRQVQDNKGM